MSLKDNFNATVAMQSALGAPTGPVTPIVITKDDMRAHATALVARGASWLDRRHPGWVERALPIVQAFPKEHEAPLYMQVGLLPLVSRKDLIEAMRTESEATRDARHAANIAAITAEEGDARYTPLFTVEQIEQGAEIVAEAMGMPVPLQEANRGRDKQIDLAYHGFAVAYMSSGFGLPSGTRPTASQLAATGFCKDDAAAFLADAWNEELALRRGKK